MATIAGVKPHPIYLAGSWVDSPDILEIANPARPGELVETRAAIEPGNPPLRLDQMLTLQPL